MTKTLGLLALLASSSLALVSPAMAHERQENGYYNRTFSYNGYNAYDNGYRNGYVDASGCAPGYTNSNPRHANVRAREFGRDRQWQGRGVRHDWR